MGRSFLKFGKKNRNKKSVRFNEEHEFIDAPIYDRTGQQEERLTPYGRRQVKMEINIYKAKEMTVHPKSQRNTQYFKMPKSQLPSNLDQMGMHLFRRASIGVENDRRLSISELATLDRIRPNNRKSKLFRNTRASHFQIFD